MWGKKPSNDEPETRRIDFDFTFSEKERLAKRITRRELDALLNYNGINTRKVTRRDFVKTVVKTVAPVNAKEALVNEEVELLQRVSGKIEARQYDTLRRLLGK